MLQVRILLYDLTAISLSLNSFLLFSSLFSLNKLHVNFVFWFYIQILMRVEQEQKVTEDARIFAEQDAAAQRYAAQVLQVSLSFSFSMPSLPFISCCLV